MYVVGVYDINVKRVGKVKKLFGQYMFWMQNSTFEGGLTKSQLKELMNRLERIIHPQEDHVIFYVIRNEDVLQKLSLGQRHTDPTNII
jgi:CRISPR-associated protein Cas2